MKNSIGAFPNMSMMMTMFNQLSDLDVSQQFGFINQENNNQTTQILMMSNFSKYFDVLLMMMQNNAHNDDDDANPIRFNVLMFVDEKVLLMIDIKDNDLLKMTTDDFLATIHKTAKKAISKMTGASAMINMNIPLLKTGYILMIVADRQLMINDDGALSVTIDSTLR